MVAGTQRPGRIPSLRSRQDSSSSWLLARARAGELPNVKNSGWLVEAVPREAAAIGGHGAASYARAMSLRGGAPPQLIVMGLLVCAMALDVVRHRISGWGGDGDANVGTIRSRRQDSAEILSTSAPSHAAKRELSRRLEEQLSNPNKKGARRHKGDGSPSQGGSPLLPKRLSSSLRVNPDSGGGGGGKSSKDKGKGKEKETGTGEVMLYLVVREDLKMSAGKVASQCAHATLGAYRHAPLSVVRDWEMQGEKIVVVRCKGEAKMRMIESSSLQRGIPTHQVCDAGRTEVESGSVTVMAIGPAPDTISSQVAGNLRLW